MSTDTGIPNIPPDTRKPRDPIYITIILLLLIGGGLMFWEMDRRGGELEKCNADRSNLSANLDAAYGQMNVKDGQAFTDSLSNLMMRYDTLIAKNDKLGNLSVAQQDSLIAQRSRIEELKKKVEASKYDKYLISQLRKETDALRFAMRIYVHRIDSLTSANKELATQLGQAVEDLDKAETTIKTQGDVIGDLEETVKAGQELKVGGLRATGIRLKSGGDQRDSDRAKRVEQIKACGTLLENKIAKAGTRTLYMVVKDPGGGVLGNVGTFKAQDGSEKPYSVSRNNVDYNNQDTELCIYYILKNLPPAKGTFTVELWVDGAKAGATTFDLK